ncbi:mitochondrial import inner membrane translocase subunit TIM44-2-like [Cicer arietinum]|uniref:Mitochondrial import inner membrane translocase subunit TIM44-2-like isoform X2 n=1 Tax=Cicer arietinum TaxID=3827 RepID=A0A1S2Z531_CICAR|nr:mitochondrial import inner membrane translocase subunit TIM44-2-like isoform X2 [Cicer arietinum]
MTTRKLIRDLLLSQRSLFLPHQGVKTRLFLVSADRRGYSVFNEFSKKIKDEAVRNKEFQQTVKELKEKAEELKGVKEDLKVKTKQKTEQLYRQVDGAWTEAEAAAKKVSHNVKEKISAATEEVKETFRVGKQDSSGSTDSSTKQEAEAKQESQTTPDEEKNQQTASGNASESLFGKFTSTFSSPRVSTSFQKLKDTKFVDLTKKGYDILKEELSSNPSKRRRVPSTPSGETSTKTDLFVIPSKQSWWSKKFDVIRDKVRSHPASKRFIKYTDPVKTKGQEIVEDLREIYDTSDNPLIHKIQDINDTMFQETDAAITYKEIRQRDPSFSLPEFVGEVQEAIKPVLNAYIKGDVETLKKYCAPQLIERCKAEHDAYKSHGIFFDKKILHISDADVREAKMLESSPVIILVFQTQQIYCVRDRNGDITEGGKDTIHTVFYQWALQQMDQEDHGEDAIYLMWRLREMHQQGIQALI